MCHRPDDSFHGGLGSLLRKVGTVYLLSPLFLDVWDTIAHWLLLFRWDTPQHVLTDDAAGNDGSEIWPGTYD